MKQISRGGKDKKIELSKQESPDESKLQAKRSNKWTQNLEQPIIYENNVLPSQSNQSGNTLKNKSGNLHSDRANNRHYESSQDFLSISANVGI